MVEPWPNYPSFSQTIEPEIWKSKLQCARLHGSVRTSEKLHYSSKRNLICFEDHSLTIKVHTLHVMTVVCLQHISVIKPSSRRQDSNNRQLSTYTATWHKTLLVLLFHKRDHAPFAHPWNYVEKLMLIYNRPCRPSSFWMSWRIWQTVCRLLNNWSWNNFMVTQWSVSTISWTLANLFPDF
jgi:hypothetical protein